MKNPNPVAASATIKPNRASRPGWDQAMERKTEGRSLRPLGVAALACGLMACEPAEVAAVPPNPVAATRETAAMPMHLLPALVASLVDAVDRGDTLAFLDLFPADGVVDDWGRRFFGHQAIRNWSDKEFIGARGKLTPQKVTVSGSTVTVDAGWKSDLYSGDSRFVFVLEGDKVREMRIVSL